MVIREETVTYVWRCPDCSRAYDIEGLQFLYADERCTYCPCGGRLIEDVEPVSELRYRLVIPESLRGTRLHRQLEDREASGGIEVAVGAGRSRHITILFDDT